MRISEEEKGLGGLREDRFAKREPGREDGTGGGITRQMVAVSCGWVAAAWSPLGLVALTLPQEDEAAADRALDSVLDYWLKTANRAGRCKVNGPEPGSDGGVKENRGKVLASLLQQYFRGQRVDFTGIAVDWRGYTPFTRDVLMVTRDIPWGGTCSYREVAVVLGRPSAARAVGRALAANRTPVVIPCHRVLCGDGKIGGFTGGVEWKKRLLSYEVGAEASRRGLSGGSW